MPKTVMLPADLSMAIKIKVSEAKLTPQQYRVFELLLLGSSSKEVQAALNISDSTVKLHTSAVYRKFNVSGRTELARKFGHFEATIRWVPTDACI